MQKVLFLHILYLEIILFETPLIDNYFAATIIDIYIYIYIYIKIKVISRALKFI